MLIYIPKPSIRVQYVFDFVLAETLSLEYELTSNLDFFKASDAHCKWSYGLEVEGVPSLPAANLLWETRVQQQRCIQIIHEDIVALFPTDVWDTVNFDIFASLFFLISRYEEYLPCVKDTHGRYAAIQSTAFQFGFLETAMVNRYIVWFIKWLRSHNLNHDVRMSKPKALVTVDIDHPFYTRDISIGKWLKRNLKDLSFLSEKDKYDTTSYMLDSIGSLASIFFILCPQKPTEVDHHNQRDSEAFLSMIHQLRLRTKIGLHPSYYAEEHTLFSEELAWLSEQHERKIKSVRFHYLRFNIETTPQLLMNHQIQNDFSLAYGTHVGFRTSTSLPFYLFDLTRNVKTKLRIYTPCIMDSVFKYHGKSNYREHFSQLAEEVKMYGGVFIPIFHNDIVSEEEWKSNFEYSLNIMNQIS